MIIDKVDNSERLDRIDERILEVLAEDGRIPVTELANRVGLSKTPCQVRMKRLQEEGYILGFRAILDEARLGRPHVSFVQIALSDTREPALQSFAAAIRSIPKIEECHMIAGSFDYLIKVRSIDMADFRKFIGDVVNELPHVASTSTLVAVEVIKEGAS